MRRFLVQVVGVLTAQGVLGYGEVANDRLPERLNLQQAISLALAKNFDIQLEQQEHLIAKEQVRNAKSKYDPTLSSSYEEGESDIIGSDNRPSDRSRSESASVSVGGLLSPGTTYSLSVSSNTNTFESDDFIGDFSSFSGLSITQPLLKDFGTGANNFSIKIARKNFEISDWAFKQQIINTISNAIDTYYALYFAEKNLEVAVETRAITQQLVDNNRKRVEVGRMAPSDVVLAEAILARRDVNILIAERALRNQQNRFKAIISDNIEPLLNWDVRPEPLQDPSYREIDVASDYEIALTHRPDFHQIQIDRDIREMTARRNRNQRLPELDLVTSYGYASRDDGFSSSLKALNDGRNEAYTIGAVFRYPLGNKSAKAQLQIAKSRLLQSEINIERFKQDILLQLDGAAYGVQKSWERIQAAMNSSSLAEQSLTADRRRLETGVGNTRFVINRQTELASAQVSVFRAITDYYRDLTDYDRLLGITLEKYNISVPRLN